MTANSSKEALIIKKILSQSSARFPWLMVVAAVTGSAQAAPVLEEVIVSAQKRSESINDVPIAISAFTGNTLDALGVTDTRDLGIVIPGLTYSDSGYATPIYTLRGIGFNDATYNATSTVGIYVDEVNLPYAVMSKGANLDIERVEVLKGPQGTLYGRNTTGGLINYIANKPGAEFEAGIKVRASRFQTREAEAYVSGPVTDTLGGRLALRVIDVGEGYQNSLTRPDDTLGKQDKLSYRGMVEWLPSETLELRLVAEGWRDDSEPQAPQPTAVISQNASVGEAALSPQIRNHPLVPRDSDDSRVADWAPDFAWRLNQHFDQISLRSRWDFHETTSLVVIASAGEVIDDETLLPQSGYSVLNAEQELDAGIKTRALEIRVDSRAWVNLNWMVGINISEDKGRESHKLFVDTNSAIFPVTGESQIGNRIVTFGNFDATQQAIFANIGWQCSDSFKLDFGTRYTVDDRDFEGCSLEPESSEGTGITAVFNAIAISRGGSPTIEKGECVTQDENGNNDIFQGTLKETNLSARTALNWTPNDKLLIYASVSRGFKSGGFPVLSSSNKEQYQPVLQEELLAYELGSKITLWNQRAQWNAAAFYYDYRDKQLLTRLLDPVFGPLPVLKNAPESNVEGIETDLTVTPLEGLLVSIAGSYIKTEIEEFKSTGFDGEPADFAGRPFNFSPELEYTVLVDYSLGLTESLLVGIAVDYSYTDETNSTLDQNPLFQHDEHGLFNARLRIEDNAQRWGLTLFGKNVTNEFSTISIIQAGDGAARFAGQPRTYGVSAYYNFY